MVVSRPWGRWGVGESVFHGDRLSVGEEGRVLEMDGRDGCTMCGVNVLSAFEPHTESRLRW